MADASFFSAVMETPLLQRALLAGGLSGLCCASLSPLVVLRRMAFIGDGMAHASFGGIGLAVYIFHSAAFDDIRVQALTLVFSLLVGLAVGRVSRRAGVEGLSEDSAIGIAFSVSMALGPLFIALRQRANPQYVPSMDNYLFGSLLNIGPGDVWLLLTVAGAVLGFMLFLRKEILFYAFDARLAEVSGLPVGAIHYILISLLVLAVVVSSRVVGIVLVSASLVLPGVTALKLSSRLWPATILSALIGVATFELGTYLAYKERIHPGSAIILIQFAFLLMASCWQGIRRGPEVGGRGPGNGA